MGKPQSWMVRAALNRLHGHAENAVIIGDNLQTDILAGVQSGVETVLVLSGVSRREDLGRFPYRPHHIFAGVEDVDVVTVVTESPLTYSSMLLKIDTHRPVGEETSVVKYRGEAVGHVTTEQYGSKLISLGGINVMKSKHRLKATRLIVGLANGEPLDLSVEGGAKLRLPG